MSSARVLSDSVRRAFGPRGCFIQVHVPCQFKLPIRPRILRRYFLYVQLGNLYPTCWEHSVLYWETENVPTKPYRQSLLLRQHYLPFSRTIQAYWGFWQGCTIVGGSHHASGSSNEQIQRLDGSFRKGWMRQSSVQSVYMQSRLTSVDRLVSSFLSNRCLYSIANKRESLSERRDRAHLR